MQNRFFSFQHPRALQHLSSHINLCESSSCRRLAFILYQIWVLGFAARKQISPTTTGKKLKLSWAMYERGEWRKISCLEGLMGWSLGHKFCNRNLPYQNLRGPLSPDIGKLDQLRRLYVPRKPFLCPCSKTLVVSVCSCIICCWFWWRSVHSTVDDEDLCKPFCRGLHRNNLYGPIPQEIGNCTTLKAL